MILSKLIVLLLYVTYIEMYNICNDPHIIVRWGVYFY